MTRDGAGDLSAGIDTLFRELVADVPALSDDETADLAALGPTFADAAALDAATHEDEGNEAGGTGSPS